MHTWWVVVQEPKLKDILAEALNHEGLVSQATAMALQQNIEQNVELKAKQKQPAHDRNAPPAPLGKSQQMPPGADCASPFPLFSPPAAAASSSVYECGARTRRPAVKGPARPPAVRAREPPPEECPGARSV